MVTIVDEQERDQLVEEMSQFADEIRQVTHQTRLLSINIAIEAAKHDGEFRRALELISKGVQDLADSYDQVSTRTESRVERIDSLKRG